MTKVMILPFPTATGQTSYLAVAGDKRSFGATAGVALDALTTQLPDTEESTLVILQKMHPDSFFSAQQQQRLAQLMTEWRSKRDQEQLLSPQTQAELDALIEAELLASTERATALLHELTTT